MARNAMPKMGASIVEEIRATYVSEPWTTAAGLARRFSQSEADVITAIMGGWLGTDRLSFNIMAKNLARSRAMNEEDLRRKFARRGGFTLEPDLEHGSAAAAIARRARRKKRVRKTIRQRKFEHHLSTYEPLVGASARSGQRARRGAKS